MNIQKQTSCYRTETAKPQPPASMNEEYCQEYQGYCLSHGKTPEEMLEFDRERYPGGCMCGFLTWSSEMNFRWRQSRNLKRGHIFSEQDYHDQAEFKFRQWQPCDGETCPCHARNYSGTRFETRQVHREHREIDPACSSFPGDSLSLGVVTRTPAAARKPAFIASRDNPRGAGGE